jgi:hypothetical protein
VVRRIDDQRGRKERDAWDGSKVVIAAVTLLLLLLLAIVLVSSASGGHDMGDMGQQAGIEPTSPPRHVDVGASGATQASSPPPGYRRLIGEHVRLLSAVNLG